MLAFDMPSSRDSSVESLARSHQPHPRDSSAESLNRSHQHHPRDSPAELYDRSHQRYPRDSPAEPHDRSHRPHPRDPSTEPLDRSHRPRPRDPSAESLDRSHKHHPPDGFASLRKVRRFIARIVERNRCRRCKKKFYTEGLRSSFDPVYWMRRYSGRQWRNSFCATLCPDPTCKAWTCLGCNKEPETRSFIYGFEDLEVDVCCDKAYLFGLWIILASWDYNEMDLQPGKHKEWKDTVGTDEMFRKYLGLINRFLELPFDPPYREGKVLAGMIEWSLITDRAAHLLRVQYLRDVTARGPLYKQLFSFLALLGESNETKHLVCGFRHRKESGPGIQDLSLGTDKLKEGGEKFDKFPALTTCMNRLFSRCKYALELSHNDPHSLQRETLDMADEISMLRERIKPAPYFYPDYQSLEPPSGDTRKFHWQHSFTYEENLVEDIEKSLKDKAQKDFVAANSRISHIETEIFYLLSCLPDGIFLKVDAKRPDIMKCLIIGPNETPFAHGLFEYTTWFLYFVTLTDHALDLTSFARNSIPNVHLWSCSVLQVILLQEKCILPNSGAILRGLEEVRDLISEQSLSIRHSMLT